MRIVHVDYEEERSRVTVDLDNGKRFFIDLPRHVFVCTDAIVEELIRRNNDLYNSIQGVRSGHEEFCGRGLIEMY